MKMWNSDPPSNIGGVLLGWHHIPVWAGRAGNHPPSFGSFAEVCWTILEEIIDFTMKIHQIWVFHGIFPVNQHFDHGIPK